MDSMAQLSSLWRDLGLNLVLRCLTGSVLMWLSNHAYCCFMALQRAASFSRCEAFSLKSAFQVVVETDLRVKPSIKTQRMHGRCSW